MMAAGTAVMYGADVTIFESTGRLGKKLAITGKGSKSELPWSFWRIYG